jgi:hypothetical protein
MMAAAPATPSRQRLGGLGGFALFSLPVIGVAAFLLGLLFRGPGDAKAIWISAALAYLSQVAAFPAVRKLMAVNFIMGWGVGSLVRLGTLLVYTLVGAFVFDLSMTPALIGLALFYFVSMLIEPLFLRS